MGCHSSFSPHMKKPVSVDPRRRHIRNTEYGEEQSPQAPGHQDPRSPTFTCSNHFIPHVPYPQFLTSLQAHLSPFFASKLCFQHYPSSISFLLYVVLIPSGYVFSYATALGRPKLNQISLSCFIPSSSVFAYLSEGTKFKLLHGHDALKVSSVCKKYQQCQNLSNPCIISFSGCIGLMHSQRIYIPHMKLLS